jgi:Putative beta-lactamase-inhibitor-like, PepSY-like
MKRHILFCICAWFALSVNAQSVKDRDVPELIKKTVLDLYPSASKIDWEIEDGMYEAEFDQQGKEVTVVVAMNGMFTMVETEVEPTELPGGILTYISMHHKGAEPVKAYRINDRNNSVTFEVEAGDTDYLFDERGNFISKEVEEGEDDHR